MLRYFDYDYEPVWFLPAKVMMCMRLELVTPDVMVVARSHVTYVARTSHWLVIRPPATITKDITMSAEQRVVFEFEWICTLHARFV